MKRFCATKLFKPPVRKIRSIVRVDFRKSGMETTLLNLIFGFMAFIVVREREFQNDKA
jgi:hypothetical protein